MTHLELSRAEAIELHHRYYTDYGLAISGLVLHHKVDPLEYNRKVDDALPLDTIITPDPKLRTLLEDINKSKVKLWLFTNAYITHAKRIVKLLGVEDMFEGITYCDYAHLPLICKPHEEMYEKAEVEAMASSPENCYFVGTEKVSILPRYPKKAVLWQTPDPRSWVVH
jgi:pyrimidine and pyridine-specific 5'-nucleotidase